MFEIAGSMTNIFYEARNQLYMRHEEANEGGHLGISVCFRVYTGCGLVSAVAVGVHWMVFCIIGGGSGLAEGQVLFDLTMVFKVAGGIQIGLVATCWMGLLWLSYGMNVGW